MRLRAHKVVLKQDEQQARAAIERAFEQAGLGEPTVAEVLAKSGVGGPAVLDRYCRFCFAKSA